MSAIEDSLGEILDITGGGGSVGIAAHGAKGQTMTELKSARRIRKAV